MMNKKFITAFMLSALMFTSCTDGNYDLSDIDTNSRFHVNGLTVPMNLDPVKMDLMLDISDDSDIKKDGDGNYYFTKEGTFNSNPINVNKIILTRPHVDVTGGVKINIGLDETIKKNLKQYAGDITIGQLRSNQALMSLIGITDETDIVNLKFNKDAVKSTIKLNAKNIDKNVRGIKALGIDKAHLSIVIKVTGLENLITPFTINNLQIVMPKGFKATASGEGYSYDAKEGILAPNNAQHDYKLGSNYTTDLSLDITGLDYDMLADGAKVFDADKHEFTYEKECSAEGGAVIKVKDLNPNAKYSDIEKLEQDGAFYDCNIGFNQDIAVSAFDGTISYSMDDIVVDPVNISNIPEMLKENGTNIDLANPQIYLDINNSLSAYGIKVNAGLQIKGNNQIDIPLNITDAPKTKIVMSPSANDLYMEGYTHTKAEGLSGVVGSPEGTTFPEVLNIRVNAPTVPETTLKKTFELGKDLDGVDGKWTFYTRLNLTDKTKIKYTKEWTDWGNEDLDGLTVESAIVSVTLQKDIALDAESIEFILEGNKGGLSGRTALKGDEKQDITLELKGNAVSEIKGGKLNVHLNGKNKDLKKDQEIKISNLKLTVNGYYDRKL